MRFRIRRAKDLDPGLREFFELCGPELVRLALALGERGHVVPTPIAKLVCDNDAQATRWLREKRDEKERRATRLEICGWAILLFVGLSVYMELANAFKWWPVRSSFIKVGAILVTNPSSCPIYS